MKASSKIIILAIDGGGIKGIIPSTFLEHIEKALGNTQCYKIFDIIGGTSTGGILSTALTSPTSINPKLPLQAKEITAIYKAKGPSIFKYQGEGYIDAKYYGSYNDKGIEPFLQQMLGEIKLSDCKKFIKNLGGRTEHAFTTSYVVNSSGGKINNPKQGEDFGPYLFNWYDATNPATQTDNDYCAWEAVRATSAAPTYFPIAHVGGAGTLRSSAKEKWALDGGVMSNNPALWGITEAFRTGKVTSLDEIVVISLGTGIYYPNAGVGITNEGRTVPSVGNWGDTSWIARGLYNLKEEELDRGVILEVILDAVQMVTNQQMESLKSSKLEYFRLAPPLANQQQAEMDNIDPKNIDSLQQLAKDYITKDPKGKLIYDQIINVLSR